MTQRTFVFDAREADRPAAQARRFLVVYATGIVINIVLLAALKGAGLPAVVGQAIALMLIAGGTYVGHARWTFRPADRTG